MAGASDLNEGGMFVVVVFLEAERGRQEEMRAGLIGYAATCLEREPGCHRYDICADPVEGSSFLLYQVYEDEAAYVAHREMPHYAEFRILVDPWTRSRRVLTYDAVALSDTA
jgi:(4S)-4-hydroxy-5-phosphonooxypentane-2,3-dione isomerase